MFSEIWQTKKNFRDLKSTLNNSFYNTIFYNTTIYFYAGQAFGSITVLFRLRLTSQKLCFTSLKQKKHGSFGGM